MEAIDVVIQEKLPERSLRLGQELIDRLAAIRSPYTNVTVTGRGLFCAFSIDESHPSGGVTAQRLCNLMRQRGVLTYSVANRVRLAPPLVIEEEDLWRAISILETSLSDLIEIEEELL